VHAIPVVLYCSGRYIIPRYLTLIFYEITRASFSFLLFSARGRSRTKIVPNDNIFIIIICAYALYYVLHFIICTR